jgi:signal recognition particle GTPase
MGKKRIFLTRVCWKQGDTVTMQELFVTMNNVSLPIDKYMIEAIVDGILNMGDIAGLITFAQDVFNQHLTLPPYTTHLKIIEFALASDLVFIYKQVQEMEGTKKNPKLSKVSR